MPSFMAKRWAPVLAGCKKILNAERDLRVVNAINVNFRGVFWGILAGGPKVPWHLSRAGRLGKTELKWSFGLF